MLPDCHPSPPQSAGGPQFSCGFFKIQSQILPQSKKIAICATAGGALLGIFFCCCYCRIFGCLGEG
jgi:hypothetical protein